MILLRYSPELGQLVDAEGKPIGVVCVPKEAMRDMLIADWNASAIGRCPAEVRVCYAAMLAAARPDLTAATVKVPKRITQDDEVDAWTRGDGPLEEIGLRASGFNAALDAIK